MASGNGPYFIDPELSQTGAPDAQMYALADGALQAHHERNQLAGLVRAATAAADHDGHDGDDGEQPNSLRRGRDTPASESSLALRGGKRRRTGEPAGDPDPDDVHDIIDMDDANGAAAAAGHTLAHKTQPQQQQQNPLTHHHHHSPVTVTSSSALFRQPSKAAKKYTRPPMSKLFASLELTPEHFLQLQSAAKNFMLDPVHPDRQETVGQRGKGDSELVKLRLLNCAKDFLENRGIGEEYFGPDVLGEDGRERSMIWPRDKNAITSAVTPLLRRMVTNERQRQYAVETRRHVSVHAVPLAVTEKTGPVPIAPAGSGPIAISQEDTAPAPAPAAVAAAAVASTASISPDGGAARLVRALSESSKTLFELTTGAKPSEYVVGELYDWPMLQPHLIMVIQQMGLPELELRQIVASMSYHLRYTHREGFLIHKIECGGSCPWQFIDRMINTGRLDIGSWEVPTTADRWEKRTSMKTLLKEAFDIVKGVISSSSARESLNGLEKPVPPLRSLTSPTRSKGEERFLNYRVLLQISLLKNGSRIGPRRDIHAHTTPYMHSLVQDAVSWVGPVSIGNPTVKVLSPEGLVTVTDDASWERAIRLASETQWMDKEMKVIIEFS